MNTPRVTKIATAQRRLSEREARRRSTELVRRMMRMQARRATAQGSPRSSRNALSSASRVASSGGGSGVAWSDPTTLRMSSR